MYLDTGRHILIDQGKNLREEVNHRENPDHQFHQVEERKRIMKKILKEDNQGKGEIEIPWQQTITVNWTKE